MWVLVWELVEDLAWKLAWELMRALAWVLMASADRHTRRCPVHQYTYPSSSDSTHHQTTSTCFDQCNPCTPAWKLAKELAWKLVWAMAWKLVLALAWKLVWEPMWEP